MLRSILGCYFYALESCWLIWLWNMNRERVQPKSDGLQPTSDGRHVANYAESTKKTARRLTVQTHEGCVALDISAVLHLPTYHMVLKKQHKTESNHVSCKRTFKSTKASKGDLLEGRISRVL